MLILTLASYVAHAFVKMTKYFTNLRGMYNGRTYTLHCYLEQIPKLQTILKHKFKENFRL